MAMQTQVKTLSLWKLFSFSTFLALALMLGGMSIAAADSASSQKKELSLITESPEAGFALAVKLSQKGVGTVQPDVDVRKGLRNTYAHNPDSLIATSQVIAIHFQTVAAANNYWKK